ncbi:MAG: class I SAM-dependent methyltransferase [Ahrensia sp.]|nr:class I SAM-dependent methyltransferase [Ahrensia sp.]
MSALKQILINRISLSGPISVSDYMAECLFNPNHGYYTTKEQPFGRSGDFITAPAISQMFGELTAGWLVECWQNLGAPSPVTLCEIGAGDGTWMRDICRALKAIAPEFMIAAHIIIIEQSDKLIGAQKAKLSDVAAQIFWAQNITDLPPQPTIFIANELFDAIPTRQFVKTGTAWIERVVTVKDNDLAFSVGTTVLDKSLLPLNASDAEIGAIFEYAPAREALISDIATHICDHRGAALFIDYGHGQSAIGDTLQAVQNHAYQDVFETPGQADITSHVDFEALTIAAKTSGAQTYPIITQGEFLLSLGLLERAGQLGTGKSQKVQTDITSSVNRLAGNDNNKAQMGDLFKVMCLTDKKTIAPPPFLRQDKQPVGDGV